MAAFADDDAFADRNGRIGNDAQMVRAGGEHPLAVVERNARSHRYDDLLRQKLPDGRKHRLDLIGFHGDDDQIGELRDRRRVVESRKPCGSVLLHSFARSRAHAPMSPGCTAPERTSPPAMACAIFPNPRNPIFI